MSSIKMVPFYPAKWASKLKQLPEAFVKLAQTPTPIHEWKLHEFPKEFSVSIKRDDYTGNLLSGNKVRKLEFIFADALIQKSTCVITCGGLQSNHCRATAIAAKQLGLDCHLLLRSHNQENDANVCTSNVLLNKIHDAKCYLVPYEQLKNGLQARLFKLADDLRKSGERPYIIPLGGSNNLGTFGIINSFVELMEQDVLSNYDDIVLATGSGGTLAGLAVANYLTGQKLGIHGICVSDSAEYFHQHIDEILLTYGMTRAKAHQICDVIEGYKGLGYSKTTDEELDLLLSICKQSGVLLDHCYTLKAVKGLLEELHKNPSRFNGNRILFIHTGGSFTVFDGTINKKLQQLQNENTIIWRDLDQNILNLVETKDKMSA